MCPYPVRDANARPPLLGSRATQHLPCRVVKLQHYAATAYDRDVDADRQGWAGDGGAALVCVERLEGGNLV